MIPSEIPPGNNAEDDFRLCVQFPGNNSHVTKSEFPSAIVQLEGTSQMNTSPGPVTRRQSFLAMAEVGESNQITTSLGPVTISQPEEALNIVTAPTKSPPQRRLGLKKKLTPRKGRNSVA